MLWIPISFYSCLLYSCLRSNQSTITVYYGGYHNQVSITHAGESSHSLVKSWEDQYNDFV